jgi:hypothetical protein
VDGAVKVEICRDGGKTALIERKQPAEFDASNEHGDVYRAIGITGLHCLLELISQLRGLGYVDAAEIDGEAAHGFDVTVSISCRPRDG